jgi:hypothetical protein
LKKVGVVMEVLQLKQDVMVMVVVVGVVGL